MNHCNACDHVFITPECPVCGRFSGLSNRAKKAISTRFAEANNLSYRAVHEFTKKCDADNEELLIYEIEKAVERNPDLFERRW